MDEFTKNMLYPSVEYIKEWKDKQEKLKETIVSIEDVPNGFRAETTLDLTFLSIDKQDNL